MGNLVDYVKRYGNISFEDKPFNDVDALLLSELVYLNFDNYVPSLEENKKSIYFYKLLSNENIDVMCNKIIDEFWCKVLLKELRKTKRIEKIKLNYFNNIFLTKEIEQFCAITFEFDDYIYIAFRGTDSTLIGWYEDFNMLLMDEIPAQNRASKYLKEVASKTDKKIIIGGHSKGGNLAVYASLYSDDEIKDRIIKIYDFDGPGFNKNIFNLPEYLKIENKITKITCEEAIIGVLLYHSEKMLFVKSRGISIFQHDLFNWQIKKDGEFKFVKHANLQSIVLKRTTQQFIDSTSEEHRHKIINLIFGIIMETPESTLFDVVLKPIKYSFGISKRYRKLPKEDKKILKKSLNRYIKTYNKNMVLAIKRRLKFKKFK